MRIVVENHIVYFLRFSLIDLGALEHDLCLISGLLFDLLLKHNSVRSRFFLTVNDTPLLANLEKCAFVSNGMIDFLPPHINCSWNNDLKPSVFHPIKVTSGLCCVIPRDSKRFH